MGVVLQRWGTGAADRCGSFTVAATKMEEHRGAGWSGAQGRGKGGAGAGGSEVRRPWYAYAWVCTAGERLCINTITTNQRKGRERGEK